MQGSEGGFIEDSQLANLGYQEFRRRVFDLFGDGPSHDLEIRYSKFHHMWFAFYSTGAYNITIDGNEYHHNLNYAVDPHSGTHDMNITNNWIHHNPIGQFVRIGVIIFSLREMRHITIQALGYSLKKHV